MNIFDDKMRVGMGDELLPSMPGKQDVNKADESGVPFKDMLKGLVDQVDTLQKRADASIEGLATGDTQNVHDVMLKLEEAGIAFDLMMKVRDKLLEAYQQVIKMQQ